MSKELLLELANIVKKYSVCVKDKNTTDEITINRTKEPLFKKLLAKIINEDRQHDEEDLMFSLAELMEVSPVTVERYMGKVCSSVGVYERVDFGLGKVIQFKK